MKAFAYALTAILAVAVPQGRAAAQDAGRADVKAEIVPADVKLLIVFANPVEGQEAGFNAWYDAHMRAFMKLPNFIRVQKFKMLPRDGKPDPKFKYMFLFEFTGDQNESFARIQREMKSGLLTMPDKSVVGEVMGMNYAPDGVAYLGDSIK